MSINFRKTTFFHFLAKAMLLLNPLSTEYFEKIDIKKKAKNPTLNGYISKTRTNSESKLKFSIFFKTMLFFARSTHVGTLHGALRPTTVGVAASGSQRSKS